MDGIFLYLFVLVINPAVTGNIDLEFAQLTAYSFGTGCLI